jgi:glycosyltransferase involved in cell wall biosynthesis
MKLSIVIPYHNRRQLFLNVLKSINIRDDVELIIVDDGSNEQNKINDIKILFPKFNINLIVLPEHRKWQNPCIAYNTGFNAATGDLIMLNSSEVIHVGDVIGYVFDHFKDNMFICFSTLMKNADGTSWWGTHSSIGNFMTYCAVLSRKNMETLSGYDERYQFSMGFDDYDFTRRVYHLGLGMICIDKPYCIHQYHEPTKYTNEINKDLLSYLDKNFPKRIKAEENKIYIR